ncbi:MAG: TIGR00289 family protein [Thermoplasmata archaeon]|nr:MAG: TIGR00289 family protein [Thermoplasmata archaeon]RLF35767.1 MAG: TIGR00289 family protein [Thermoplasmata archaeon]
MRVAALLSGGKDSVFAIYITKQLSWDISYLITMIPENKDSWMFHSVNIHLAEKIAESLCIPLIKIYTMGEKEKEMDDLKEILGQIDIDGVISGAISSEYQRTRIENICYELNIRSFTPLWHKDPELLLRDQISADFKIMIVGVFAQGFDESWLGRIIDEKCIKELNQLKNRYGINMAGEGGEFETLVLDAPLFKKKLVIDGLMKRWRRDHGTLEIKTCYLMEK